MSALLARVRGARLALLLVALSSACGYSSGLRVTERHRTVGLEVFKNDSFERDLERLLYDELARALRDYSDAELVDPSKAEVVVRGTIQTYHRRSGIRSTDNQLLETGVYIQVAANLHERGSTAEAPPVSAHCWVGFVTGDAENERTARDRALRHIAEEVVLDLFTPVN